MKKQTFTMALFAVLSTLAVGCQKETIVEPQNQIVAENGNTACIIVYSVDGVAGRIAVMSPTERAAFIHWMAGLAEEGHRVTFRQEGNTINAFASKDTQTYSSKKKHDVEVWAVEMMTLGYEVTITYDESTGYYTGTATTPD